MMVTWFERKFDYSTIQNIMPSIIERLNGTPVRVRHKMERIDPSIITLQLDGKWSILEQIGHLGDLEPLWCGRLDDILNDENVMRAADLGNTQTNDANHNSQSWQELLARFESLRNITIHRLQNLKEEDVFKSSLHPRLKTPMRTLDLFTFVAEHDDHHLATMTALANRFK
jgi:uncharacterized damage-inducible protein DinB